MEFENIEHIFNKYMDKDYFTGGVCYISVNGKKAYHEAFGLSNKVEGTRCNLDTVFDLASITKIVTSTVILKMISENALSLTTKLEKCLPQSAQIPELAPITIKQLLTHSSGLKAWHSFYANEKCDSLFAILNSIDLTHKEARKVVYSDLNFILLGEVIKYYYQSSLQHVFQNQLAEPLDLESLTYNPHYNTNIAATEFGNKIEEKMCNDRNFHFTNWRNQNVPISGEVNDGNTYYFFGGESGHAGLFSNVKDLVSIGELYLKGGINGEEKVISNALIEESFKKQVDNRGLGWETSDVYPEGVGHTGFTGTALWIEPERNVAVGLLTNRLHVDQPKNINPFRKELFEEIFKNIS
ncbi:serine hydrolase domain-containing protein [Virgibacillus litoralis]|uniref:CubicO group peptidase (Beta-lactamase class C family) n=1 Tax=Virgibacillus litoralis TaxID=578221 RepID=A0ABS4HB06_9BACI|nr:serine hydrolase domain-containing protein [Virgibacillus litoralis]MBP1948048.1 CubicO group peptidase (beta-lactamase class C family) [Virgibacillus litoralis]